MSTEEITDVSQQFEVGNKVHRTPPYAKWKAENGIVKSVTEHGVFVVYNCGGEWSNYQNYTAALTDKKELFHGWK